MSIQFLKTYVTEHIDDMRVEEDDETVAELEGGLAEIDRLQSRVESMEEDVEFLGALRAAGVDNWEGYGFAHDIMEGNDVY